MSVTLNQPAVLDLGSGLVKAGFAGVPTPTCIIGSIVARPKLSRVLPAASPLTLPLVGDTITALSGVVRVNHPLERGIIVAPDDAQALWNHVLSDQLKLSHGEHPVLVTENAFCPRRNRERIAEIFFEAFQVPSLFVGIPAVLALYASGRTTGVVLDVGDSVTTAVPIAEGHIASHAVSRMDLGGRDISDRMAVLLRKSGASLLATSSEKEAVRRIKERVCYVARDPRAEDLKVVKSELPDLDFELPDGNIVSIGSERFHAPEVLFDPSIVGTEYAGVHMCVHDAINNVDVALRKQLYSSVLLAGGASKTRGFAQRLLDELRPLPPPTTKVRIHAPPDRLTSAFTGGSILASLSTFRTVTISSSAYFEQGTSIVHRSGF